MMDDIDLIAGNERKEREEDASTDAALPAVQAADLTQMRRDLAPSLRIMLDERLYSQVKRLAGIMSKDTIFTPKHLVGKPEACFTVITQAVNWNINPQFVARCTYQTPGGSIGFEGKLIQAVLEQSGRFVGAPKVSYIGDWSKVIGKFTKQTSQRGNEFVKPAWTEKDAEGLGIIVSWQVRGEAEPRIWPGENEPFYLTQCYPLNSPLWATDARTQIRYLAMRRFADGAAPGILGGMSFDHDDLLDASQSMRDVTPPRPTRADFAAPVTDVETYDVVDYVGDVFTLPSIDEALERYQQALDEGEHHKGEAGLTTVWDNNGAFFTRLEETGNADLSKQLSREYGERRQAAAAREQTEREKAAATKAKPGGGSAAAEVPRGTTEQPSSGGPTERPDAEPNPPRPASGQPSDLFANRDPAFWQRRDGKRVIESGDFMQELAKRLLECRDYAETSDIERHNAGRIKALMDTDKAEVVRLFAERRNAIRGAAEG